MREKYGIAYEVERYVSDETGLRARQMVCQRIRRRHVIRSKKLEIME